MAPNIGKILATIETAAATSIGSELGRDLYAALKAFLDSQPAQVQQSVVARTSIVRPGTFLAFELDQFSHQAAAYLLSQPPAERRRLVAEARRASDGNEENVLVNLLRLTQGRG